jgi:formylglycine-generating enzyme required for sulfatase activity
VRSLVEEAAAAAAELGVERQPAATALRDERSQWEQAKAEGLDRLARACVESIVAQVSKGVDRVGSHGRWKGPCLQTNPRMRPAGAITI